MAPLAAGPCVVLTRTPADNAELAAELTAEGVPVRCLPCLQTGWIAPPVLPEAPQVLVFTSRRGVQGLARLAGHRELFYPDNAPAPLRAVVGPGTAAASPPPPRLAPTPHRRTNTRRPRGAALASRRGVAEVAPWEQHQSGDRDPL